MSRRNRLLALLLVVGAALASFSPSLHGAFVNWDDQWLLLENPYVQDPSRIPLLLDPTAHRDELGAEYLPLRDLNYVLDFALFGKHPRGYRWAAWLLYGLASGMAFALLLEALRSPPAALAGALLWAVHPLHAEVVPWVSARKDLLNAVFALLAATLYLRAIRTRSARLEWAALGAFLLATLSKTTAAPLPVALAAWEVLAGDPAVPTGRRVARAARRAAPMLLVAAAGAWINAHHQGQDWIATPWKGGEPVANFFIMGGIHLDYLRRLVLPLDLSPVYAVDEVRPDRAWNLAGVAVLAASLAATAWLCRRRPLAGWAALWWFVVLVPVSNLLVPITNAVADRYVFLPSLGACALAGLGFGRAAAAGPRAARGAAAVLCAAVLALGILAARQCLVWRSSFDLWSRAVAVAPGSGRAWMNYAEMLAIRGRHREAVEALRRMIAAEPLDAVFWMSAGNRIYDYGGPEYAEEAEEVLRTAVRKAKPGQGGPLVALAWLVNARGRKEEAVELLQEAARIQPDLAEAHYNLGLWHWSQGRWERAVEELEEAMRLGMHVNQEVLALEKMADSLERMGERERAAERREEWERKKALPRGQ